jgi:hypothetical protein
MRTSRSRVSSSRYVQVQSRPWSSARQMKSSKQTDAGIRGCRSALSNFRQERRHRQTLYTHHITALSMYTVARCMSTGQLIRLNVALPLPACLPCRGKLPSVPPNAPTPRQKQTATRSFIFHGSLPSRDSAAAAQACIFVWTVPKSAKPLVGRY